MSNKQLIIEAVQRMSESATLSEISETMQFSPQSDVARQRQTLVAYFATMR